MRKMMLILAAAALVPGTAAAQEIRPGVYRTPDARFENLPGYDFAPHYEDIQGYRVHYLDEGPADGQPILLLHGEPTWSYLYRKMIPVLTAAGYRTIVPDLIGFGRSDKPASMDVHTYEFHVEAITDLVEALNLRDATFFGQDWGGLIGLRVVAENEERFARVVISNTGLRIGTLSGPDALPEDNAFMQWKRMNQGMIDRGDIPTGAMVSGNVGDPSIAAAYDAPFPDPSYKAGPLIMPQRVPVFADDPANDANRRAWEVFSRWEKPFLTAFSDGDPITRGGEVVFQQRVPGANGQPHTTIEGAGHFVQEQAGEELARVIVEFIANNPLGREQPAQTPGFADSALDSYEVGVQPSPAAFRGILGRPDARFVMVNMLVYKDMATGSAFEGLTGAAAYGLYVSGLVDAQAKIGSRLIWSGEVEAQIVGSSDPIFHTIALLEYASPTSFIGFASSPGEAPQARGAGLRGQWLVASTSLEEDAPSTATASSRDLPSTQDLVAATGLSPEQLERLLDGSAEAPVFIVELLRFADDSGDSYGPYRDALEPAIAAATGSLVWRGAFDSQLLGAASPGFHEVVVTRYPNRAAYLQVLSDGAVRAVSHARIDGLALHWIYAVGGSRTGFGSWPS